MNNAFSNNLVLLRKGKGLSQKQVALDLKISQALLSHYEKGVRECGLDFLVRISDYYDVSCDFILGVAKPVANTKKGTDDQHSISATIDLIYDTLKKINNQRLNEDVGCYLSCATYTMLRYVCKDNYGYFMLDEDLFSTLTSSKMALYKANIKSSIKTDNLKEVLPSLPFKEFEYSEKVIKKLIETAEK